MGNAYDYSIILNQDKPVDYTKLEELMFEFKKLAQMRGCRITNYLNIMGYLFDLEIKCDDDHRKIIVKVVE